MQVPYGEGVAIHIGPEPCADARKGAGEAPHRLIGRKGSSVFTIGGPSSETLGPNPYDLLSAALGACTVMTIRVHTAHRHYPLRCVRVGVSFQQGAAGEKDIFERTITLEGDLTGEQKANVLQIANMCPVGKILGLAAEIVTFLDAPGAAAKDSPPNNDAKDYERDVEELSIPNIDPD